jgi:chromosome partitioning protein
MAYIISVSLLKGGVGKTTTAIALAEAASYGGRVKLIDCDPQGSARDWWERAAASGKPLRFPVDRQPTSDLARRISSATLDVDMAIIDAPPPGNLQIARGAIEIADYVVIPVPPQQADLARVPATAEIAREHGRPARAVLTLVRAGLAERDSAVAALATLGVPVFGTELPLTVSVQRNYGQVPYGVLARYGFDLMTEILEEAKQNAEQAADRA